MRVGIIDLGTNTFNLAVADIINNYVCIFFKNKIAVKLGQGGLDKNIIAPEAFQRGLSALEQHKATLSHYKVEQVLAFATSAIRSTTNGPDFVKTVKDQLGITINVISGDEEAELIYLGVKQSMLFPNSNVLIIDIGGGSTEFIIANNEKLLWKQSFLLGVSRIKEKFKISDPIQKSEIELLINHLSTELKDLFNALEKYPCSILIGSSGSFDSFAEMIAYKHNDPKMIENVSSYEFNIDEIFEFNKMLLTTTYDDRIKVPGLVQMRADMIVIAGIFIEYIIHKINAKKVYLSKFALKEGALARLIADYR